MVNRGSPSDQDNLSDLDPSHRNPEPQGKVTRFLPRTIRGMLILLLLIMLIPVLLVQAGYYYSRFEVRLGQELQANLELSRSLGSTFDTYVSDILHQELAIGIAIVSPLPDERVSQLLVISAQEYPAIDTYSWIDPSGRIATASSTQAIGTDLSDRPYFQQIIQGREWAVSDLFIGRVTGKPLFAVARGIRDEQNALRGVVLATVDPERLGVVLSVGIAPESLPYVFERYYRVEATRRAEGVGLGLYITKMLVEAHDGHVGVESELGKGSTFYFSLLTGST